MELALITAAIVFGAVLWFIGLPVLESRASIWEVRQWGTRRGREPWYVRLYYLLKG